MWPRSEERGNVFISLGRRAYDSSFNVAALRGARKFAEQVSDSHNEACFNVAALRGARKSELLW